MHLMDSVAEARGRIIIPTPALAEVLVRGGSAAPGWLQILNGKRHIRIADFDQRAAVEFAALRAAQIKAGTRHTQPRWKARIDEQIAAIAVIEGATTIYSDDADIGRLAEGRFTVIGIADMPLPPEQLQTELQFHAGQEKPMDKPHQEP